MLFGTKFLSNRTLPGPEVKTYLGQNLVVHSSNQSTLDTELEESGVLCQFVYIVSSSLACLNQNTKKEGREMKGRKKKKGKERKGGKNRGREEVV